MSWAHLDPVPPETRKALANARSKVPERFRTPTQFLGRQYAGCGATIGLMPRCDLSCQACYLGEEGEKASPSHLGELKHQLRMLAQWLGPAGNLQLTDGEITLRPEDEIVELIASARAMGLVPMLMTNGETLRYRPGMLERLMTRGGLSEICFHVDTTMRGRRNGYSDPCCESDLDGLRQEFADMVRRARRSTGLGLEAASTVTVTHRNLDDVPGIVRWFFRNADAFKMLSFQPAARVGRTPPDLAGVRPEPLWRRITEGAGRPDLRRGEGWLGHPDCTRFVQGLIVGEPGGHPVFHPLYRGDLSEEMRFLSELMDRIGGLSFRLDGRLGAILRASKIVASHPGFLARRALPQGWRLLRRASGGNPVQLLGKTALGRTEIRYFNLVSHHFMSPEEAETASGRERLALCVFRVPIGNRLEPMCAVNALGLREAYLRTPSRRKAVPS
jgi:hypothetical protein